MELFNDIKYNKLGSMDRNINMKRWTIVFRALANVNRLKIIKMLSSGRKMNVGDIANTLEI